MKIGKIASKTALILSMMVGLASAQDTAQKPAVEGLHSSPSRPSTAQLDGDDLEQLRAEVRQLTTLLNQMRTNLAFVQSTETPLKHQFELEADAWQMVLEQMKRRLERIEAKRPEGPKK